MNRLGSVRAIVALVALLAGLLTWAVVPGEAPCEMVATIGTGGLSHGSLPTSSVPLYKLPPATKFHCLPRP